MDSPNSPQTSRRTILARGVKEATGSLYPSKIKHGLIMPISLPHLMDKVDIWECFYGIIPTYVLPPSPFFPPNVLQPGRDGALENLIVVHENTHRITNRMTVGGTGRCLQMEAGGLGEGWSDAMAEWVPSPSLSSYADYVWRWTEQKNATVLDYVLRQYVRTAVFLGGGGDFYVGQVSTKLGVFGLILIQRHLESYIPPRITRTHWTLGLSISSINP